MTIYIVTDHISGIKWYYTSISAVLEDIENPLEISNRRWSQIVKEKGYPFFHSGCKIERVEALTTSQVRAENPPIIKIMKAQNTNQTLINAIAKDNAWAVIENIEAGLTIDEACEAQVNGAMNDPYDDEKYDAPYDRAQLFEAYKKAVIEKLEEEKA